MAMVESFESFVCFTGVVFEEDTGHTSLLIAYDAIITVSPHRSQAYFYCISDNYAF